VDVEAPRRRAIFVALALGGETDVGEAQLRHLAVYGNLQDDFAAIPFARVLHEAEIAVRDLPHDLLVWNELGDALGGTVHVLVSIREHRTERVGLALDVPRPPSTHVG